MPIVSPSISSLRRLSDLLLPFLMAIAVSYLFSVMPFGNPNVAFMPPVPGPCAVATDASQPGLTAEASITSNDSSWDCDGQVVWATLNDIHPLPLLCAALETLRLSLMPLLPASRQAWFQRPPPRFTRLLFHLRAPPLNA